MKILLAVDDSSCSQAAMQALMKQFQPGAAEICVLHSVDVSLGDYQSQDVFDGAHEAKRKYAKQLVEGYTKKLQEAGYSARSVVKDGNPEGSIVEFAESWKPEFIFLGSHGRTGWKRLTLGSVSEAVAHRAHSSVVIVRPQPHA